MESINTIGRRKTSVARVYMQPGKGDIKVNSKDYTEYFPVDIMQIIVKQPLSIVDAEGKYDIKVNVEEISREIASTSLPPPHPQVLL